MKVFSLVTNSILCTCIVVLYQILNNSNNISIFPPLSNTVIVYMYYTIFVVFVVAQLYPKRAGDSFADFSFIVTSLLGIPMFVLVFAFAYMETGLKNAECRHDFLYFSIVTISTLGYGDILPEGKARSLASAEALVGFLFVPLLISQLLNALNDLKTEMRNARLIMDDPEIQSRLERDGRRSTLAHRRE